MPRWIIRILWIVFTMPAFCARMSSIGVPLATAARSVPAYSLSLFVTM